MSKNQPVMTTQGARCGVRLNYTIFPIDFRELRHVLAKNGYELSPIRGRIPFPPAQIAFSGDVARKEEITVTIETDSGEIGVVGRSLQKVKEAFKELGEISKTELGINLHENVKFYSYAVHYRINTGKTPRIEIAKAENKDCIARFSKVLGQDISSFSVRVSPKNAVPNQESWFDIAIEPDVLDEKSYHVGVVFRTPNRVTAETFVRDLENKLVKLLEIIEA